MAHFSIYWLKTESAGHYYIPTKTRSSTKLDKSQERRVNKATCGDSDSHYWQDCDLVCLHKSDLDGRDSWSKHCWQEAIRNLEFNHKTCGDTVRCFIQITSKLNFLALMQTTTYRRTLSKTFHVSRNNTKSTL